MREYIAECTHCGLVLSRTPEELVSAPFPCPRCGGGSYVESPAEDGIVMYRVAEFIAETRPPGQEKFLVETRSAEGIDRQTGRRVLRHRTIDRMNDAYHELVIAIDSGEIVYEMREKLSDHQGRGSARSGAPRRAG